VTDGESDLGSVIVEMSDISDCIHITMEVF